MKGIVFSILNQLIEEKFGITFLNELIESVDLPSGGIYTSGLTYDDSELFILVKALSEKSNIPIPDLIYTFGRYMMTKLHSTYSIFFKCENLKQFLKSIDRIVHVEVKKLYPEAHLPTFDYFEPNNDTLVMYYKSPRGLEQLARGLIEESAGIFKENINIQMTSQEKGKTEITIIFNGRV